MKEQKGQGLSRLLMTIGLLVSSMTATGIIHGTMHITAFTPNLITRKYDLKSDFRPYLLSMYNDQKDQNVKEFRIPVEVHVHRKQHENGTWMMENYVELPFPIYYDHMRVMKLTKPACHVNLQNDTKVVPVLDIGVDDGFKSGVAVDSGNGNGSTISPKENIFLSKRLTDVYEIAHNINLRKKNFNERQEEKNCHGEVIEPEGFVFLFDNPVSEGMMKVHSRREPERIVPRHSLFYHLNQGLQLYFNTNQHNDLVDRFDEGDLTGNQFGAILHTIKYPKLGHFSANFFVDHVERFDLDKETQIKLTGNKFEEDEDEGEEQTNSGFDGRGSLQGDLATQFANFKKEHVMENGVEFEAGFSGEDGFEMFREYLNIDHFKGNTRG